MKVTITIDDGIAPPVFLQAEIDEHLSDKAPDKSRYILSECWPYMDECLRLLQEWRDRNVGKNQ
jgi:hypothetical protein